MLSLYICFSVALQRIQNRQLHRWLWAYSVCIRISSINSPFFCSLLDTSIHCNIANFAWQIYILFLTLYNWIDWECVLVSLTSHNATSSVLLWFRLEIIFMAQNAQYKRKQIETQKRTWPLSKSNMIFECDARYIFIMIAHPWSLKSKTYVSTAYLQPHNNNNSQTKEQK